MVLCENLLGITEEGRAPVNKFQEACSLISVELPDVSVSSSHVLWRPWDVAGPLVLVGVNEDILKKKSFLPYEM